MSSPYVGEIRIVGFNFAPEGWAMCDGSAVAITENETLFALIGTTYGGDGVNTFNLPNLLGRLPVHMGTDRFGNPYVQGQFSGSENVTLLTSQLPQHSHGMEASSGSSTTTSPSGAVLATSTIDVYVSPTTVVGTSDVTTSDPSNGGQPHENLMPFLCATFIISLFGIFPSQS